MYIMEIWASIAVVAALMIIISLSTTKKALSIIISACVILISITAGVYITNKFYNNISKTDGVIDQIEIVEQKINDEIGIEIDMISNSDNYQNTNGLTNILQKIKHTNDKSNIIKLLKEASVIDDITDANIVIQGPITTDEYRSIIKILQDDILLQNKSKSFVTYKPALIVIDDEKTVEKNDRYGNLISSKTVIDYSIIYYNDLIKIDTDRISDDQLNGLTRHGEKSGV